MRRTGLRGLAAIGFGVAGLAVAVPAGALAGTLDQQQTGTSSSYASTSSSGSNTQTFTAGLSGGIDQVDLSLAAPATPTAPLTVEIRDVSGGLPGNTVLASQSVSASSVSTTPAFVPISFASPATVASGTQYAIVAYSSTPISNSYRWFLSAADDPYAGGAAFYATSSPPSSAWIPTAGGDFAFKTYVAPPGTTLTGQRAAALKKCKKKHSKKARKKCRNKANLLPV
jgi:hypothetical protein